QGGTGPDRGEHVGQVLVGGGGAVHAAGGHQRQTGIGGELGERIGAHRVQRVAGGGDLHGHVVGAEGVGEPVQLAAGGGQVEVSRVRLERAAHAGLAAAGEHQPVPGGQVGQLLGLVVGLTLGAAGQVGVGDRPGQPPVALRPAGQHQQVG